MPIYLLAELCVHLPALEAGELLNAATSASVPHTTQYARDSFYFQMDSLMHANDPPPATQERKERDPAKAAEYFRSIGVKVVESA